MNDPEVMRFHTCSPPAPALERAVQRLRPTVTGSSPGSVSTASGRKKLFHVPTTLSSSTVTIAGFSSGSATVKKVRISPAPSMRAASSISSGTASCV